MKKWLVAAMALAVVGMLGTGCGGGDGDDEESSLTGRWRMSYVYFDGSTELWIFNLQQNGNVITGTSWPETEPNNVHQITGTLTGTAVSMVETGGDDDDPYYYNGTTTGENSMQGTCGFNPNPNSSTWTAARD